MAGIYNEDDSTDDEFGVNLQLAERLRINKGDAFGDGQKFENSKDAKQFYNLRRKKYAVDGRSSSSSSDNPISCIMSSDVYPNKKRQNGDKNIDLLANPKRTCLSDRYRKMPDCPYLKKKSSSNGYQNEQLKYLEPIHSKSSDVYSTKNGENQINIDSDDSDFEKPKFSRNYKKDGYSPKSYKNRSPVPKSSRFQNYDEPGPSTGYKNSFFENGSDEETKKICKSGALKGGRQEPPNSAFYSKRLLGRKVNRKVLDSESEDEKFQSSYRSHKPVIFSSSDSEDFNESKDNHTSNDTTSNGSSSQSLSCDSLEKNKFCPSRMLKSPRSNQKICKKSSPCMSPIKTNNSDSCDQFMASYFQRKNSSNRPCRARRSSRINMSPNMTSNGFSNSSNSSLNITSRGRRHSENERGTRKSGSPHHRSLRSQCRDHESKSKSAGPSHSQNDFCTRYSDIFDAEESDNEFFTANSYSDTETSTESLGVYPSHRGQASCSLTCNESRFEDVSTDDEISVVFSTAPHGRNCDSRRVVSSSRALGRRYNRGGTPHRPIQSAQEIVSLSPDPVEQVRQVEEDERMARMLQEQFDAELDPDYNPVNLEHVFMSQEDSDDEIDPVLNDSDSESGRNYHSYTTFPHHSFRARFPGRSETPTFSAAIFLSPRRNTNRRRRRFQSPRDQRADFQLARLFGLELPGILAGDDDYETLLSLDLNGEVVPRGLRKAQINRLPTRKYVHPNTSGSSEAIHKRAELNKECQVCLTDYETGDTLRILPCFHEFHTPCIDPWLKINHTCPVCRVTVDLDT